MRLRWALVAIALVGAGWFISTAPARVLEQRQRAWGVRVQPGDVIFQDLDCGPRCELIREVTHSRYTHVGVVLEENGELSVWEAYEPVGPTDLVEWVHRGIGERVAIYRFQALDPVKLAGAVRTFAGRPYDADYQWDDERIYCSELVAKAANLASDGTRFRPHAIGDLGPHAALVRRMSHGRISAHTEMITPLDLTRSPELVRLVDELAQ